MSSIQKKLWLWMTILTGILTLGQTCTPPPPGPTGNMAADTAAAQAAGQSLAQAIDAGTSTSDAINSLVQTLKADPKIVAAGADVDGQTAWALFESGIEYVYEVIDEDAEDQALQQASQFNVNAKALSAFKQSLLGIGKENATGVTNAQLGAGLSYVLPANNKAVLANALYQTRALQDIRTPIKAMLEACGYEVTMVDADLDFFKNLSKYSVIFIEAHGSPRKDIEKLFDSAASTYYNDVLQQNLSYCGLQGNEAVLQTSTRVKQTLTDQYKTDLECGRLKIRMPTIRRKGKKSVTYEFYAVTPNFIRQYDKGTFPSYALMCLNSCRSFSADGSPWATLLYEKSYGSIVVGWDYRVQYATSSRAMLHLFQFLAGTNHQFDITDTDPITGVKTIYPLLFKTNAPVLPQTVSLAMDGLKGQTFDYDPVTGAHLTGSGDTLYGTSQLILAPAIEEFQTRGDGTVRLTGRCQDKAEITFTNGSTFNIGTLSNGSWTFSLPVGNSGPMALQLQDRKCLPRDLLRWSPFTVTIRPASTSNSMGTCDYQVTYQLSTRAIASGDRFGSFVWNDPDYAFDASWDPDASSVSWSINGNATIQDDLFGPSTCNWSGGNSRNFNEVSITAGTTGDIVSYDGKTAYVTIDPPFDLLFMQSCSGIAPPSYACGLSGSVDFQVQLTSNWTIIGGSTTDLFGQTVIEWQTCMPDPTFDSDYSPR